MTVITPAIRVRLSADVLIAWFFLIVSSSFGLPGSPVESTVAPPRRGLAAGRRLVRSEVESSTGRLPATGSNEAEESGQDGRRGQHSRLRYRFKLS